MTRTGAGRTSTRPGTHTYCFHLTFHFQCPGIHTWVAGCTRSTVRTRWAWARGPSIRSNSSIRNTENEITFFTVLFACLRVRVFALVRV